MSNSAQTTSRQASVFKSRMLPGVFFLMLSLATAAIAGPRYGLLLMIGASLGITLEGLRFGFAGPWRRMIIARDPSGVLAQLLSLALIAIIAFPLLETHAGELKGAHAPIGWAMIAGAFVFGAAMQVILGCGSGTLVNAGSGNLVAVVALPFFALGSFLGAHHLFWWISWGTLPVITLGGMFGLIITLVGLALCACLFLFLASRDLRKIPRRLIIASFILAFLAIVHLIAAGQPWGVVYGLGLWVAKGISLTGIDLSASAFWGVSQHQTRLSESLLTDVTSLTNLGLIAGAAIVAFWRDGFRTPLQPLPLRAWISVVIAGLLLGYSSRLAFGCNVGAFFSGIATGSLHGWAWFLFAFAGSWVGIRLRPRLGLE